MRKNIPLIQTIYILPLAGRGRESAQEPLDQKYMAKGPHGAQTQRSRRAVVRNGSRFGSQESRRKSQFADRGESRTTTGREHPTSTYKSTDWEAERQRNLFLVRALLFVVLCKIRRLDRTKPHAQGA